MKMSLVCDRNTVAGLRHEIRDGAGGGHLSVLPNNHLCGWLGSRWHADTLIQLAGVGSAWSRSQGTVHSTQCTVHSTAPSSVMISAVGCSVNTPHPPQSCNSKQSKHSNQLILASDQISYNGSTLQNLWHDFFLE